ncbi:thioredoxin reductase [Pedobacter sp. UYP24]
MGKDLKLDAIIIGGSYAGLSAALALGRSLRSVLVIDGGRPCNRYTPRSHNFLTQDGNTPMQIHKLAKKQVATYKTVSFFDDVVLGASPIAEGFVLNTLLGEVFSAKKLIFSTGIIDVMPDIKGFEQCWGISILHCPYCHGYEVRNQKTGVILNGEMSFELVQMVSNWTKNLILFTNGTAHLSSVGIAKLHSRGVMIIEVPIQEIVANMGMVQYVVLVDGSSIAVEVLYARPQMVQHCSVPEKMGCDITDQGLVKIDGFNKTTLSSVFACGDNANPLRSISSAVAAGTLTGAMLNREMIIEEF